MQLVTYPASEHRGDGYLWPARLLRLLQPRIPAHGMVLLIVRGIFLPYSQSDLETDSQVCPEVGLLDLVQQPVVISHHVIIVLSTGSCRALELHADPPMPSLRTLGPC